MSDKPTPKRPHEEFAEKVLDMLESGTAPWQKSWKAGELHAPFNPATGTVYNGVNRVALSKPDYADPRWMTFRQANEEGLRVKAGAKAEPIVFWQWTEKIDRLDEDGNVILDADGQPEKVEVELDRPRVHYYSVFHVARLQQENSEDILAYEPQPLDWNPHEKAEAILQNSGAIIYHDQRDRAFYRGGEDAIHLPPKAGFEVAGEYYSTALHELGHWACAKNRLDIKGGPFGSELYAKEELKVEIASWMICQDLGLDFKPENSAAYLDHWRKSLNDDPYEIVRACRDAERIKKYVLGLELEQAESLESQLETLRLHRDERGNVMNANIGFSAEAVNAVLNLDLIDPASLKAAEQFMASLDGIEQEPELAEDRNFVLTIKRLKSIGQEMEGSGSIAQWREVDDCLTRYMESVTKMIPLKFGAENITAEKIYLDVPYKEKEAAKGLGATWDRDAKKWCARPGADLDKLAKWLPQSEAVRAVPDQPRVHQPEPAQEKIFLQVPYREKEQAKAFGAKWDKEAKLWFAPEGADLTQLAKWIPEKEPAPTPSLNPAEEFTQKLEIAGFKLDGPPVMDGCIHRAAVEGGKPGSRDGSYCAHADGKPNGWLQNHRTGEQVKWVSTGQSLTAEQKAALKAESAARLAERKKAREKGYEEAAGRIFRKLGEAATVQAAPEHPYLKDKGVKALGLSQDADGNLLVVGVDLSKSLLTRSSFVQTMQTITPGGKKYFEPGSKKSGAMHLIGREQFHRMARDQALQKSLLEAAEPQPEILMAEGYATAASLHMATGKPVAVAFDAGNLKSVAIQLREKFPKAKITICADNDHKANKNVGLEKALDAAQAVQGRVVMPDFNEEEKKRGLTDFNDLHKARGLAAVAAAVNQTLERPAEPAKEKGVGR